MATTKRVLDEPPSSVLTNHGFTGSQQLHHPRMGGATRIVDTPRLQSDTTSDRATVAFVRRTLCSHNVLLGNGERGRSTPRPIEEVLPPLTSSNEVDLQLYGIISVIIKEFVQAWYSKITPDQVFVNEVLQIIAHCTRGLEQRLRNVDLEALLLDEIPELLETHLTSIRLAKQQSTSLHSLASDPRLIYHTLHPHPALSPVPTDAVPSTIVEQRESESAWRQLLVQGVLAVLLPTEDLENGCVRALVAEIFAEMIIGNGICGKACEGWLLWEAIASIAKALHTDGVKEEGDMPDDLTPEQSMTRLERFGLMSSARDGEITAADGATPKYRHKTWLVFASGLFWTVIQYTLLASTALRAAVSTLATSSSLPSRFVTKQAPHVGVLDQLQSSSKKIPESTRPLRKKRPVITMGLWSCVAQLTGLSIQMPWLSGSISMLHWGLLAGPGRVGDIDGILDRFLSDVIHRRMLDPTFLPAILRGLRTSLFPNNALGPPRQLPSNDEVKDIKKRCAVSILALLPPRLATTLLASEKRDTQLSHIEEGLNCLEDPYLNKHLIFQIVELIVVRLIPELGVQGVQELMEDRSVEMPPKPPAPSISR